MLPSGMWLSYFKKGQPLVQLVLKGSSDFEGSGSNKSYSHLFRLMPLYFGERYTVTTVYAVIAFLGILPVLLTNKSFHMLRGNWQIVWIHNRNYTKVSINYSSRKTLQWSNILPLKSWLTTRNVILLDMTSIYNQ